jgi:hypothetical protein
MKKIILIFILLIFITSCTNYIENTPEETEAEIFCPNYDGNQEACLSHTECQWDSEGNCDSITGITTDEEIEENELASNLEDGFSDTYQNEICKQLPLTKELSPGERYYCFAVVNKAPGFCEEIKADDENDIDAMNQKSLCLAHSTLDSSYCKQLSNNEAKHTCYFRLSLLSEDIDVCDEITYDSDERQLCYFSFSNAMYWEDKSNRITDYHCNKLPEPDRSTCFAYKNRDISYCGSNVNCLTHFEQPMSFCTTGKGKSLEYCIRDRAMTEKNLSICETLAGEERDDCIGDIAGHITMDTSTCDLLSNDFARNSCYGDVAVQSGWLK